MLSGIGRDDAIPWDFFCTVGRGSGVWTKIPVPSCWELQGFGIFNYGNKERDPHQPAVEGRYRRSFAIPPAWKGKRVFLVFDASMTDTEVLVNGASAGPKHQGAFYQFRYEITKLVHIGTDNTLEVTVTDESTDDSVNRAERRGDYWNYGGIFRPVYLEAVPEEFLERQAIDARADGTFAVDIALSGIAKSNSVEAQIVDDKSQPQGAPFSAFLAPGQETARLQTRITAPKLWNAESPNLYKVLLRLKARSVVVHEVERPFGFRTFEVRVGEGLYLNGQRIFLKGCDRHSFWPDSGRTCSPEISKLDVGLIKEMNMNTVRMSHYPPDEHFLDQCDKDGLYVLDELTGWQKHYDTGIGQKLVREFVQRDVNHPSILFWDNGNEGGWNTALDTEFEKYDPQMRHVLHPWARSGGVDTKHYPSYAKLHELDAAGMLWMPTEFLHGLDDGGAGAGLNDYFEYMRQSKTCVGGIIWAYLDEAVKRVDEGGRLDTKGNSAPDGIVGPYREKEGSFYTIKEIWSPVSFTPPKLDDTFRGTIVVENRYSFANLAQCKFSWQLRQFPKPDDQQTGFKVLAEGEAVSPTIPAASSGSLRLDLPEQWPGADALSVKVSDWLGREVWTAVWPISSAAKTAAALGPGTQPGVATIDASTDAINLSAAGVTVQINKQTGCLSEASRAGKAFALKNGPRPVMGSAALAAIASTMRGPDATVDCTYTGAMKSVRWTLQPNGCLKMEYEYAFTGQSPYVGVTFDCLPAAVKGLKWLGDGPYRVYKNRLKGGILNVWESEYNDIVTGRTWGAPEFKGYFSNVRWAKLIMDERPITMVTGDDGTFLRMLTPDYAKDSGKAVAVFPEGDLSFLQGISAIGSKFSKPEDQGPEGGLNSVNGTYKGTVSFLFGNN